MNQLTLEQLELIASIEGAFKDDPERPKGATTLHEAMSIDEYETEAEQLEARKLDADHSWQEVSDEEMTKHPCPFSFLNEKGKRHYLPAYMRFSVKHRFDDSSLNFQNAWEMLILNLYPWTDPHSGIKHVSVGAIIKSFNFNKNQCKVIYDFLRYFEEDVDRETPEWVEALKEWKRLSE